MADRFFSQSLFHFERWATEAHDFLADAFLHDLIETDKGAAADKQNLLSVNLDIFLVRMFTATLWGHVAGTALENFQQRLLDSFTGYVPGNTDIVGLATDLIDFVDVDDADLSAFHVVISILQ